MHLKFGNKSIKVEIASNIFTQTMGLMFRKKLKEDTGMLFIFPLENTLSFWMLFTYIPLDIIWINKDKKVVDIKENTVTWDSKDKLKTLMTTYNPKKPAKYALEVETGFVKKHKIEIGDMVIFE
jgi:hypothetical protein